MVTLLEVLGKKVQNFVVSQEFADMRLDRFLRSQIPGLTQAMIQKWLRKGLIRLNDQRHKSADTRLQLEDKVATPALEGRKHAPVSHSVLAPAHLIKDFKSWIVYECDEFLVINKPAGLAVQGGSKLKTHLDMILDTIELQDGLKLRLVHRLDKETSGLLILAKSRLAADKLTKQFARREISKSYIALVVGGPDEPQGVIDMPLSKTMTADGEKVVTDTEDAREAVTHYQVVETLDGLSALLLEPKTGRTHQLRAHCQYGLGTPILGDGKYGSKGAHPFGREEHLFLHAFRLTIPIEGSEDVEITVKPPHHFFVHIKDLAVFA